MSKGKFLFYFCGNPVYGGDENHKGLKTLKILNNNRESSKRMTRLHAEGKLKKGAGNRILQKAPICGIHYFTKKNAATQEDKRGAYDLYKCDRCGLTGKRYGLSDYVTTTAKIINKCKKDDS